MSALGMLADRKIWPFFYTQFLGAFNDNFYKNALVILVTYKGIQVGGLSVEQMVALSAGIFILPFFLFSVTAGQMADKFSKQVLIHWVKGAEIAIMALATLGFVTENILFLLGVLFLMGLQSALFGPVKYGVLPQLAPSESQLIQVNALVQMGTFLAIPLGTIAGGVLIELPNGPYIVSGGILLFAGAGFLTSQFMPHLKAEAPDLRINRNPLIPAIEIMGYARKNRPVFLSILGIAWFWFFGASLLTIFPTWCKNILHGDNLVATFFLVLFSVGIGVGSILTGKLSKGVIELGLVPVGSIGMTIFTLDLFFAGNPGIHLAHPEVLDEEGLMGPLAFISTWGGIRVVIDLFFVSVFGGFFIVPLQTMIQERSEATHRARVISCNNIINSGCMVLSAIILMALPKLNVGLVEVFLLLAIANVLVAIYVYTVVPEFLYRFVAYLLVNFLYRLKPKGLENIPDKGAAVLISNHVTFVDWLVIGGTCPRPTRFVMHHSFKDIPIVSRFMKRAGVIPIASAKEDPELLQQAMDKIAEELELGNIVCIFPEGMITKDGELNPFKPGIEKIVERTPVPIIPMALVNMWGSFFSKNKERKFFGRFRSQIELRIEEGIAPEDVKAEALQEKVQGMLAK